MIRKYKYEDKILYDYITLDEISIKDYIEQGDDYIVFVVNGTPSVIFGTTREEVAKQMAI